MTLQCTPQIAGCQVLFLYFQCLTFPHRAVFSGMELHIRDEGSLFLLDSGNEAAEAWLAEHLDGDGMKWGTAYVVEARYVDDIVAGFEADGGTVNILC